MINFPSPMASEPFVYTLLFIPIGTTPSTYPSFRFSSCWHLRCQESPKATIPSSISTLLPMNGCLLKTYEVLPLRYVDSNPSFSVIDEDTNFTIIVFSSQIITQTQFRRQPSTSASSRSQSQFVLFITGFAFSFSDFVKRRALGFR
ncbi:hypothetical protein L1887_24061 [Cichorium endivia]|nr:hypothetical protein L1887_24061 [Cichorium endivia]